MSMKPGKSSNYWEILQQATALKSSGIALGQWLTAHHKNKRLGRLKATKKRRGR